MRGAQLSDARSHGTRSAAELDVPLTARRGGEIPIIGHIPEMPYKNIDWLSLSRVVIMPRIRNHGPGVTYATVKLDPSPERPEVRAFFEPLLVIMSI